MKRHSSPRFLAFASGALALLVSTTAALANDHHGCTLRNVAGTYGYTVTGIRNGIVLTETFSGTYTVNDDCTGSTVLNVVSSIPAFNRTSNLALVWDADEARFRFIFTDADTILTGDGQRTH